MMQAECLNSVGEIGVIPVGDQKRIAVADIGSD